MVDVLNPGFYSSIQDLGRLGVQEYGVPFSGAMDQYAHKCANAILGNHVNCATLEITMVGPKLQFKKQTSICIVGAIMNPKINQVPVKQNQSIEVRAGDILNFGKLETGYRCYLAVKDGFKTQKVMNSRSMYSGITHKHHIKKGDLLKILENKSTLSNRYASLKVNINYLNDGTLEVFEGPEFHLLSEVEKNKIRNQNFTVSKDNNRMAYQLQESIKNTIKPIITSMVMPGSVQITPSGKLIILMRDCQTTGGYPRILQLSESAINCLSQKFNGQTVSFKFI